VKDVENGKTLIVCLETMMKEYNNQIKTRPQLKTTIDDCLNSLDDIMAKINDQKDKGAKNLRMVEAFKEKIDVNLKFLIKFDKNLPKIELKTIDKLKKVHTHSNVSLKQEVQKILLMKNSKREQ